MPPENLEGTGAQHHLCPYPFSPINNENQRVIQKHNGGACITLVRYPKMRHLLLRLVTGFLSRGYPV